MIDKNRNNFYFQNAIESECIFGFPSKEDIDLTIVIPTYNRVELLERTLNSIVGQKKVDKLTYQVIIVSNDPDFSRKDIIMDLDENIFSIYRNKENLGMVGNMNRCATIAKGRYISYVQDDDLLLNNYLVEIESLITKGNLDDIDCLIPNRYYYYNSQSPGIFGKTALRKERLKYFLRKIISIGTSKRLIQKITAVDCAETWYNCFAGGPTCGILFNRESLLKTKGFDIDYPYAFDYVFFLDYSLENNVVLYDKYLSIYRMNDSASNRPEVQKDFYDSGVYLIAKMKKTNSFVQKYEKEIIRFNYESRSAEAKRLIGNKPFSRNSIKYFWFRFSRIINLFRRNVYRKDLMPDTYIDML